MSEGKKPRKPHLFKPGCSGNPGGRPKKTDKERAVEQLTKETWNDLCQKMMTLDRDALSALLGQSMPYEVELFIRHMLDLGERPSWDAYEKYLARRIGKVPSPHEVSGPGGGSIKVDHSSMPQDELNARIAELNKKTGRVP